MSPQERLLAAQRALGAHRPASDEQARATERRVMASVAQGRVRAARSMRVTLIAAALVALGGSTAWAAATGRLDLGRLFKVTRTEQAPAPSVPAPAAPSAPERSRSTGTRVALPAPAPAPAPIEAPPTVPVESAPVPVQPPSTPSMVPSAPVATTAPVAPSAPEVSSAPVVPRATATRGTRARRGLDGDVAAASPAPQPRDEESPADEIYRRGHEAHFVRRDYRTALAAWDEYLRVAPRGRFAPEVRFNRALDLLRLGRRDEARALFEELARGSYRAGEAARVLDALRDGSL